MPPRRPWRTRLPEPADSGCRQMVVKEPGLTPGSHGPPQVLPANCGVFRVGLPRLEPGSSSLSENEEAFLDISRACKIAANKRIFLTVLFLTFQDIYSGCCTITVPQHSVRWCVYQSEGRRFESCRARPPSSCICRSFQEQAMTGSTHRFEKSAPSFTVTSLHRLAY
jgi:hypothetical protein